MRSAISGVTLAFSARMRCRVWRVMPRCLAAVDTGILNAGRVTSLSRAPGWLGASSGCRSVLRAMIILQVDVDGVFALPTEGQSPVSRHDDGEPPGTGSFESVEAADVLQVLQ